MAEIEGYYDHTWEKTTPPTDTNLSVAFSGWSNLENGISESDAIFDLLIGRKYFSFGGGGETTGNLNEANMQALIEAINKNRFSKYDGLVFDVEVGDSGLTDIFHQSFQAAKSKNLKVLVTVSHSAPYGIVDAKNLMTGFFADDLIDFLSPQLYTSGTETQNDFDITTGQDVTWQDYLGAKAALVPSIVTAELYESAKDFFADIGITTAGYLQWAQTT